MGKSGKTKSLQINKTTRNNLVTYGIVIAAYIIVEILINGGHLRYPCWLSLVRSWSPEESHRFSETFCKREK